MLNSRGQRELAYVVSVTDVLPMNADRLECVRINGWNCVCSKGAFKAGDLGIFFEIDSLIPEVEPFTSMEFLKNKHYKIKSQKIRGVISQGLLLSFADFDKSIVDGLQEGDFLTEKLGVTYYIKSDNARKGSGDPNEKYKRMGHRHPELAKTKWWRWLYKRNWGKELLFIFFGKKKDANNKFPKHFEYIHVTDEERCENMPWVLTLKDPWIKTTKIDGTSSTYILERKPFGRFEYYVCSRNVRQMDRNQENYHNNFGVDDNVYWSMNDKYKIYDFLRAYIDYDNYDYVCLQGETAGPGLQGNPHKFDEVQFFGFNLINSKDGRLNSVDAEILCSSYNIPWVPIIDTHYILPDDFEEFKLSADGPCEALGASGLREGYVYRSLDGKMSFKNVSRKYLISKGE